MRSASAFAGPASRLRRRAVQRALLLWLASLLLTGCLERRPSHGWEATPPPESSWSPQEAEVFSGALEPEGAWRVMREIEAEMSAKADPVQINLPEPVRGWKRHPWTFTPRALYGVEARVLARRRYRVDDLADIVPLDFALGWNRMVSLEIADELQLRIRRRFYRYRWYGAPPLPPDEITRSSANTHIIPADEMVQRDLMRVRRGDWVRLYGFLVDITYPNGFVARTSMVRTDTGAGACENLWVVAVEVIDGPTQLP